MRGLRYPPRSTRGAAPLVADASMLQTHTIIAAIMRNARALQRARYMLAVAGKPSLLKRFWKRGSVRKELNAGVRFRCASSNAWSW